MSDQETNQMVINDPNQSQALVKFEDFSPSKINEMVGQYLTLSVPEGDSKAYKIVRTALTTVVSTRTGIDKRRKQLGEEARLWINQVNDAAKTITKLLEPAESHLRSELDKEDARKEAIRLVNERKEKERIDGIRNKISSIQRLASNTRGLNSSQIKDLLSQLNAIEILETEYMELTSDAANVLNDSKMQIEEAFERQLQVEKEDEIRKAETARLEELRKKQAEEQAKIDAENARIEEENRKIREAEERIQKEREAAELKIKEEEMRIEAERQKLIAEQKAEQERREAAELKKQLEEKRIAKEAEDARIKKEAEEAELRRQEELKPDREKFLSMCSELVNMIDSKFKEFDSSVLFLTEHFGELKKELHDKLIICISTFASSVIESKT
jgi:hypothetical protein